jgi:diguanylate cyclase (GGDEF)-like protein
MSDVLNPKPLSLHELVNQLNRPPAPGSATLSGIMIEQDWVEALRRRQNNAELAQIETIGNLMDEIAKLQMKLEISEAKREQLEQLIDADPLCPVLNRRAFERELSRAIAWSKRTKKEGSVLFLDLNGLKPINDTYGHAVGDKAIERVAKMLILSCRSTDLIGRLGGDEFAVIMPDTPISGALVRGDRVDALLRQVPLMVGDVTLDVSAAYGASSYDSTDDVKDVLKRADAAMYAHKQKMKAGRS